MSAVGNIAYSVGQSVSSTLFSNPLWPLYPLKIVPFRCHQMVVPAILNHVLREQLSTGEFDFLENKFVTIHLSDLAYEFTFTLASGRFALTKACGDSDVVITGSVEPFLKVLLQQCDPDTLFFQRKILIEGDTQLGLGVKNILDTVDIDKLPSGIIRLLRQYQKLFLSHKK